MTHNLQLQIEKLEREKAELLEALLSIRGDMGDGGEWESGLEDGGLVGPTALRKVEVAIAKAEATL